ncbi:hypothetical protein, partial [Peribacillus sp. NPDC056705]|uniref:hypothetical protein n=1 Tax=Peribacillus sp. NPDC056705 TaxID=3345918 RepID=UPI0037493030
NEYFLFGRKIGHKKHPINVSWCLTFTGQFNSMKIVLVYSLFTAEPPGRLCACGISLGLAFPAGLSHLPFQSTLL